MATIHVIDPDGRHHWADEESNLIKSGLESGHFRRDGEPAPEATEPVEQTGEGQGEGEPVEQTGEGQGEGEQVEETGEEAEDAAVEQDGVGADADGDASGPGNTQRAPRGSRKR